MNDSDLDEAISYGFGKLFKDFRQLPEVEMLGLEDELTGAQYMEVAKRKADFFLETTKSIQNLMQRRKALLQAKAELRTKRISLWEDLETAMTDAVRRKEAIQSLNSDLDSGEYKKTLICSGKVDSPERNENSNLSLVSNPDQQEKQDNYQEAREPETDSVLGFRAKPPILQSRNFTLSDRSTQLGEETRIEGSENVIAKTPSERKRDVSRVVRDETLLSTVEVMRRRMRKILGRDDGVQTQNSKVGSSRTTSNEPCNYMRSTSNNDAKTPQPRPSVGPTSLTLGSLDGSVSRPSAEGDASYSHFIQETPRLKFNDTTEEADDFPINPAIRGDEDIMSETKTEDFSSSYPNKLSGGEAPFKVLKAVTSELPSAFADASALERSERYPATVTTKETTTVIPVNEPWLKPNSKTIANKDSSMKKSRSALKSSPGFKAKPPVLKSRIRLQANSNELRGDELNDR